MGLPGPKGKPQKGHDVSNSSEFLYLKFRVRVRKLGSEERFAQRYGDCLARTMGSVVWLGWSHGFRVIVQGELNGP